MEQLIMNPQSISDKENKPNKKYLLQINRIKLIDYISRGLILPDRYLDDECEKDIQSKNTDFLIVSDGYIKELDEYQILIELIFTEEEKQKLHKVDDSYYFDFPLPLTRVKKIYVENKNIINEIFVKIINSENGFLPKELFDVYMKSKNILFDKKEHNLLDDNIVANSYEDKIRVFDKRMGMFTFMKNNEFYYCDETSSIANYSNHYFSTLSTLLKEALDSKPFEDLDILKQNASFKDLLFSDKQIDKEFIEQEAEKIENDEIKEIFLQILEPTGSRDVLFKLLEKNQLEHYLIGLLYYFRQKDNNNKKDNFKIGISNLIPYKVSEVSLAILGIYLGYKRIRSSEKIEIEDKNFKSIFEQEFNMKFTFKSKLDYIIVEILYNICFNGNEQKGYEYEYLTYPAKKSKALSPPAKTDKEFYRWYEVVESKTYFDIKYIKIKKKVFKEIIDTKLEKHPDTITSSRSGILIGYILQKFPSHISPVKFGEKLQISCEKSDILEILKDEENRSKQNYILDILELDSK